MEVMIKQWGNSASVRIPSSMMRMTGLQLNEKVRLSVEEDRIVIEPVQKKRYQLKELVDGINDKNRHKEANFDAPVGRESW